MVKKDDEPQSGGLDYTQAKIRMPVSLRELLGEKAQQNSNTLNAEIISRLQSSLAADQSLGDPEMIALWADLKKEIDYAEQATGKKWRADTAAYAAAHSLLVAQLRRFQPPMENQQEIFATRDEMNKREGSLNARLEILERCGVIIKREANSLSALSALAANARPIGGIFGAQKKLRPAPSHGKVYEGEAEKLISDDIMQCGYVLVVDLEQNPEAWDITDEDGSKAAPTHGAAMSALLVSIPKARNDVIEAETAFLNAYKQHKEAEAMGMAIAKNKLQGHRLGDLAAVEGEAWLASLAK
tara:strand:+ start:18206 stop:19102 length:897 start_codon:yes stop_codon:yes gene_type:complete